MGAEHETPPAQVALGVLAQRAAAPQHHDLHLGEGVDAVPWRIDGIRVKHHVPATIGSRVLDKLVLCAHSQAGERHWRSILQAGPIECTESWPEACDLCQGLNLRPQTSGARDRATEVYNEEALDLLLALLREGELLSKERLLSEYRNRQVSVTLQTQLRRSCNTVSLTVAIQERMAKSKRCL